MDPGALAGAEAPAARAPGALAMRKRVHSCRRLAAFCEDLVAAEHEVLGYDYWVSALWSCCACCDHAASAPRSVPLCDHRPHVLLPQPSPLPPCFSRAPFLCCPSQVTDGLYGSMNSVLYDHATLTCRCVGGVGGWALPGVEAQPDDWVFWCRAVGLRVAHRKASPGCASEVCSACQKRVLPHAALTPLPTPNVPPSL